MLVKFVFFCLIGLIFGQNDGFRLNDDTWPSHYKVRINALENNAKSYKGEVEITFKAMKKVSEIVLNQQGLQSLNIRLFEVDDQKVEKITQFMEDIKSFKNETQKNDANLQIKEKLSELLKTAGSMPKLIRNQRETFNNELYFQSVRIDQDYEKIICTLESAISLDTEKTYLLQIKFSQKVYDDYRGFYESYYDYKDVKKLATTHFGQQARRLFPSWDEPRFKATFDVSIRRNESLYKSSISNGKLLRTVDDDTEEGYKVDYFEPTVKISPHHLALVVSNFEFYIKEEELETAKYRAYLRPDEISLVDSSLKRMIDISRQMDYFTDMKYFDIEGVKKLDMAVIPDLPVKSMGNWGVITIQEGKALQDFEYLNAQQEREVVHAISRGVVQQWFGKFKVEVEATSSYRFFSLQEIW